MKDWLNKHFTIATDMTQEAFEVGADVSGDVVCIGKNQYVLYPGCVGVLGICDWFKLHISRLRKKKVVYRFPIM